MEIIKATGNTMQLENWTSVNSYQSPLLQTGINMEIIKATGNTMQLENWTSVDLISNCF